MDHKDALQEMSVEQYLLGELRGASLDRFEEHLFDCQECTADLKAGLLFVDGTRREVEVPFKAQAAAKERTPKWADLFTSPWVLGPALAACLVLLAIQSFVLLPRMQQEVASAHTPSMLNTLVLANAGPRGGSIPEIAAPQHGAFALSADIPTAPEYVSYECSLYSPDGSLVWQTGVTSERARDSVLMSIPAAATKEGINVLRVQGLRAGESAGNGQDLASYKFRVQMQK